MGLLYVKTFERESFTGANREDGEETGVPASGQKEPKTLLFLYRRSLRTYEKKLRKLNKLK
jgi:hypothetical protein